MTTPQRIVLRAARRIHQRLAGPGTGTPPVDLPEAAWAECRRLTRRLERAEGRGWSAAARQTRERLHAALANLQARVETALRHSTPALPRDYRPTLRQVHEELAALHDEFDQVEIDLKGGTLAVVTEPVVLEDVDLGRFEIRLDWGGLVSDRTYEVIALDPNPAACSSDTTHPHVQGDHLCEGEGRLPIRQALEQGRLCDFFLVVAQILGTYNPGSAYVRLDDWSGRPCADCGASTSDDDASSCRRCGSTLCPDCSVRCAGCEDDHCSECLETCDGCDAHCCRGCRSQCQQCRGDFCDECLTDGLCDECRQADPEDGDGPDDEDGLGGAASAADAADSAAPAAEAAEEGGAAGAAVLPGRLGQAPVPA